METQYGVYVRTNSNGYITDINSSEFLVDTADWVQIDEGYGDRYHHAQRNYLSQPILTSSGAYRYKLVGSMPVTCTAEEIEEQEAAAQPDSEISTLETRVTALEEVLEMILTGVTE